MNILASIVFGSLSGMAFGMAKLPAKEIGDYSCHSKAKAKVSHVIRDNPERKKDYKYCVEFKDNEGYDSVGYSEYFSERRYYKENDETEIYYWKEEKPLDERIEDFLNSDENIKEKPKLDNRTVYDIHFCDKEIYKRELRAYKRGKAACNITGCVLAGIALYMLKK